MPPDPSSRQPDERGLLDLILRHHVVTNEWLARITEQSRLTHKAVSSLYAITVAILVVLLLLLCIGIVIAAQLIP